MTFERAGLAHAIQQLNCSCDDCRNGFQRVAFEPIVNIDEGFGTRFVTFAASD
jgi:hypothetical protein